MQGGLHVLICINKVGAVVFFVSSPQVFLLKASRLLGPSIFRLTPTSWSVRRVIRRHCYTGVTGAVMLADWVELRGINAVINTDAVCL